MKSVLPIISLGLLMCEEGEGKGRDGRNRGQRKELLLGTLQEAYTCILVVLKFKEQTPASVSEDQGGSHTVWGELYLVQLPHPRRMPSPFRNWKNSQDVHNFMDGRTPISQNLNGKTM